MEVLQHPLPPPESFKPAWHRKPRLRRREASEYLAVQHGLVFATSTLEKLASVGGGPVFRKCNRTPLYETADLDRWAASKLGPRQTSTSDTGA